MAPADEATHIPEADVTETPQPAPDSDAQPSPPEKDWKEEYARLRKDYDQKSARLKEIDKPKEEPKPVLLDEVDWKIENAPRLKLVREEYTQELAELQAAGTKITPAIQEKALRLAEERKGINRSRDTSDAERQAANGSAPGIVHRTGSALPQLTEHDRKFGLTAERKKELESKYPELKEEI